jgi:hypothetical protein
MIADAARTELHARISGVLRDRSPSSTELDELLGDVAAYQARTNPVFARLCRARRVDFTRRRLAPDEWPAVPTDVFRHARVATYPDATEDIRVFRTSGTTSGARGAHFFRDLSLYDLAAERAAREMLFGDRARLRLIMLAPSPIEAPDSSLSYMLGRFEAWFATETAWCWREGRLDVEHLRAGLDAAVRAGERAAILGTSFAMVHAEDALAPGERWALPPGSLTMTTGGFKGRTRETDRAAMEAMLESRFGIARPGGVIGEYGMTELSSQMYEVRGELCIPEWVRVTAVDPETLRPVAEGQTGILRIDDLANLDSVCSIQTSDLARRDRGGVVLLGRAPGATPRGCSLAIEEALSS